MRRQLVMHGFKTLTLYTYYIPKHINDVFDTLLRVALVLVLVSLISGSRLPNEKTILDACFQIFYAIHIMHQNT